MSLFKKNVNSVGRPSNETLKKRRNKKIAIIAACLVGVLALGGGAYVLFTGGNLFNLMGNSVSKNVKSFKNPVTKGADPWVIRYGNYYYYLATGNSITIYKTDTLSNLKKSGKKIYQRSDKASLWAPELHHYQNHWYIYFAAPDNKKSDSGDYKRRMYVLKSKTNDPMGEYEAPVKVFDSTDQYAIDGTLLQWKGKLYFVWSGLEKKGEYIQHLYIAPMSSPTKISGKRVKISSPTYSWETANKSYINEGPEVLISPTGQLLIIYSASGAGTSTYCLGMLSFKDNGNILNPSSWKKSSKPLFESGNGVYGPGHASFVKGPNNTNWIIYHAYEKLSDVSNWGNRKVRIQSFYWSGSIPVFGKPVSSKTSVVFPQEKRS